MVKPQKFSFLISIRKYSLVLEFTLIGSIFRTLAILEHMICTSITYGYISDWNFIRNSKCLNLFKHDFLLNTKIENNFWLQIRNQRQISRRSRRWRVGDGGLMIMGKLTNIRYRGQPTHSTWVDSTKSELYPYVLELQITCSRIADVSNNY